MKILFWRKDKEPRKPAKPVTDKREQDAALNVAYERLQALNEIAEVIRMGRLPKQVDDNDD